MGPENDPQVIDYTSVLSYQLKIDLGSTENIFAAWLHWAIVYSGESNNVTQ